MTLTLFWRHLHCFLLDTPVAFERKGDVVTPWCYLKLSQQFSILPPPSLLRYKRKLTTSVLIQSLILDFRGRLPYTFLVSKETVVLRRWEGEA